MDLFSLAWEIKPRCCISIALNVKKIIKKNKAAFRALLVYCCFVLFFFLAFVETRAAGCTHDLDAVLLSWLFAFNVKILKIALAPHL